jgi:hypothetical protein
MKKTEAFFIKGTDLFPITVNNCLLMCKFISPGVFNFAFGKAPVRGPKVE